MAKTIVAKPWGKEDELKALKSVLATLDRKITAELAPTHEVPDDRMGVNHDEKDGEEVKRDGQTQQAQCVDVPAQSNCSKESLVAEPQPLYKLQVSNFRPAYRPPGL